MSASRSARLLLRSLLAVAGGIAACADGDAGQDARLGELGTLGPGGSAGAPTHAAGSGGGAGSGIAGGGAAGASSATRVCEAPHPLLVDGQPTGMMACADGSLERSAAATCRLPTEPLDPYCDPANGLEIGGANSYAHPCETFCTSDADCPENKACACRPDGVGVCAIGECRTTGDCADGRTCRLASVVSSCMGSLLIPYLWCVGTEDVCASDMDCAEDKGPCGARDPAGRLRCDGDVVRPPSSCGRPIFVEEAARIAPLSRGVSWVTNGWSGSPA